MPSKKEEPKKKRRRRGSSAWINMKERPINTYNVGVYFPDRDLEKFVVKAHGFQINSMGNIASFHNIGDMGIKEFIARFTHVAYILLAEDPTQTKCQIYVEKYYPDDLPKDFGNVT